MKVFIVLALAAVALADNAAPAPSYSKPAPKYERPSYKQPEYNEPPRYTYSYAVQDHYSGNDFNADENRDGYTTSGSYRVALPDGRTQIVTYTVNGDSGYVADVRYEGEAQYPDTPAYSAYPAPQPSYPAPAPAYEPAHQEEEEEEEE